MFTASNRRLRLRRSRAPHGVTIMEVLISIFILMVGVISIISVFPATLQLNVTSTEISTADRAALAAVDELTATQAYAFPSGVAEGIDSSDSAVASILASKGHPFGQGNDHRLPNYILCDTDIAWGDLATIFATRGRQLQCDPTNANCRDYYTLVKKNSPGEAERRRVLTADAGTFNSKPWGYFAIYRGSANDYDPSDDRYLDRTREWLWPVRKGARYWVGSFREDRESGRFPAYARIKAVTEVTQGSGNSSALDCEVVQEGIAAGVAGTWGAPDWPTDCWKGFVLIHTGDHQEILETGSSDDGGTALPTERASALGRVYLITGNEGATITCARADFAADGFQPGDFIRIAGNNTGRTWWPDDFLNPGSFYDYADVPDLPGRTYRTRPVGTGSDYSYACIISGWENDIPNLYRVDIFVYRNFDGHRPPERNTPIARFGTLLAGR